MFPGWEIGGIQISTFGIMMAIAFMVGGEMTARSFERFGRPRDEAWQIVTWCLIGGVLGAKLWYVVEQIARTPEASASGLLFSRGGLTWYGGFAGGGLAGLLAGWRRHISWLKLTDLAAATLAAGQAIGRIGCFLVGDDYGQKSDLPWALSFPRGLPPTIDATGHAFAVHPTMIYESLWLAVATFWLWQRRGRSPFLFGEYLVLAGTGRLWIEVFRTNPALLGPLSNAQIVASLCISSGAAGWLYLASKRRREFKQGARARASR